MQNHSFIRSAFGVLSTDFNSPEADQVLIKNARALIALAVTQKKIPRSFDNLNRGRSGREKGKQIGDALHHEIYDIAPDCRSVLVCCRAVTGNRYGMKTTSKTYFLIRAHGTGTRVTEASKALSAKAAKSVDNLGDAIAIVAGKKPYHSPENQIRKGFKLVKRIDEGSLVSVWDNSEWPIGKTRIEAATEDHSGGFYYYEHLDAALAAAATNTVFGDAIAHNRLVAVEVEASGKHYAHHNGKLCASRLRVVREVAMTL